MVYLIIFIIILILGLVALREWLTGRHYSQRNVNEIRKKIYQAVDLANWKEAFKEPNIISVLMQSIYIGTYSLSEASLEGADVAIQPQVAHIGLTDFRQAQDCIEQGELAAEAAMPEIKRKLQA